MSGFEIMLVIVLVLAVATIVVLALRNRELEKNQKILMGLATKPVPQQQPLPQAAEVVSLAAFDRATDRRDVRIAALEKELGDVRIEKESWMTVAQERGIRLNRLQGIETKLAASESERERLAGLYQKADLDRQRLALENKRLGGELN